MKFNFLEPIILSRALFSAAELNIAEIVGDKSLSIAEIAEKSKSNPEAISRLLNFLIMHEVFCFKDNVCIANNHNSNLLKSDDPESIKAFILHDDPTRWNSFGNLTYSIQTGDSAFESLYGTDYFSYIADKPTLSERFDLAMKNISAPEDKLIANKINFSGKVADIGGGVGNLLNEIFLAHQNKVSTILCDLENAIQNCPYNQHQLITGSFFEKINIQADIYILKRILHDWDDQKAQQILNNVAHAMAKGSKLYIIEGIMDHNNKFLAAIDLAMLALFKGKERSVEQFDTLAANAGLQRQNIYPINDMISAIELSNLI